MEPEVETVLGRLRGIRVEAGGGGSSSRPLHVYRGIPYAAAPIGDLRFRAPVAQEPWAGIRDARDFGPSPMQSKSSLFSGGLPGNGVREVSEDCLNLNVWAPAGGSGLPVMVWVCGGAYLTGGTCIET